jgi:DNA-directed RNA polymerase subunit RPC12/RpoP
MSDQQTTSHDTAPALREPLLKIPTLFFHRWFHIHLSYYCAECVIPFYSRDGLFRHLKNETPHGQRPIRCPVCGIYVPTLIDLTRHIKEVGHLSVHEALVEGLRDSEE